MSGGGQSRKRSFPDEGEKKRTVKACDRCKLKKIKCDGQVPCGRCQQRDTICHFGFATGRDEKDVSAAHVNQLQLHNEILVRAVRLMWERYAQPTMDIDGAKKTSIHRIVASLGILQAKSGLAQAGFDTSILDKLDLDAYGFNSHISPEIMSSPDTPDAHHLSPTLDLERETMYTGLSFPGHLDSNSEPDLISSRTSSSATDTSWSAK